MRTVKTIIHNAIQRRVGTVAAIMAVNLPLASSTRKARWGLETHIKREYKAAAGRRSYGGGDSRVAVAVAVAGTDRLWRDGEREQAVTESNRRSLNQQRGRKGRRVRSKKKRSLWAIGIDFMGRSHRSGSDLRWSREIEDCGRILHLLYLLCSFPGFRPQTKGELEERPRVNGQLRRHFVVSCVPGYWRYVRREHWIVGSRISQLRETGRGRGWTRGGRAGSEERKGGEGRVNAVCFIWCRLLRRSTSISNWLNGHTGRTTQSDRYLFLSSLPKCSA